MVWSVPVYADGRYALSCLWSQSEASELSQSGCGFGRGGKIGGLVRPVFLATFIFCLLRRCQRMEGESRGQIQMFLLKMDWAG